MVRMKRFYLMLCFLMSIIGSAWGQETVTNTFVVDAADGTNWKDDYVNKNNPIVSTDGKLSITFEDGSEDGVQFESGSTAFKFRRDDGYCIITPEDGVIIKSISLTGKSTKRDILYIFNGDTQQTETSEGENDNWTNSFTNTDEVSGVIKFARTNTTGNVLITKIEVTYTYTPDKTGLIQIPVDMLNISANTTAGDGFDRFYRGVNLNFAGNAVVSAEKNMVTLGATTDKLAAGNITVTVPDQTDADGEYIQQVQFNVNGGIITDDNKTTLLKVYNGDTEITGGTWNASGTTRLIWDAPADVKYMSLKFVDNADEANTPAITQVQVNVYEVKTLANSGRLETALSFAKAEQTWRTDMNVTIAANKVKVNGSEYNNFEVLYTFDTEITENEEDGRTYYSLKSVTPVTIDPVTGSTINPATGQVTTGATAGTVKVIAYYDGLQEGSTDNANYAYNPVKAEYTLNVVAPAVIEIGDEEKVAKNIHVQEYGNCSINGTWQDGQLMDSSTDGAYVTFKVKPTVDGTYTFTSEIGTVNDERTITLSCNDGSSDIFTETKDITNNGNWTNNLGTYTWTVPGLKAGTEYTIKLQGNKKSDVGNNYIVNLYPMTIVRVATQETTTTFNVSDFNYASGNNSRNNNLDRSLRGFDFVFSGNDGLKCNNTNTLDFRTRRTTDNGSVAISTTNGANILSVSFTFDKDMTGYYTAKDGEGNDLASSVSGNVVTVTSTQGVSKIVFAKVNVTGTENDDKAFALSAISLTTDTEMPKEKCQPVFAFEHASLTVAKTGDVANALTTTPKSYPVTFSSSNPAVATVDAEGVVTLVAAGKTTITVSSTATNYFNAANASYSLTVVDDESVAGKTWDFTTWSTKDITTVAGGTDTWNLDDNDYYKNKTGTSQGPTDFGLDVMEGLLISTTGSDQIRIYPNSDGQTDGSIRLQSKNAKIYMPELKAGQTITLTMMTTSASSARGMVFSGAGADKVQLIYGTETSKTMNVVTYRVTENISAEELIMSASTGGLNLYSIKLGYSELYWMDGSSNPVTDVAVTAAGETSYTLNSAADASYTITDANGNESADVAVNNNGKVVVNTFTLGKTHTITATVDGHSATLTLRMVNTASISYEQTTATGTLGFSFVEPVLTKEPAGLNVVKWKSSNPEVATVVADNGEVTFVSAGTTTITAYIEANNYYAYTEASYTLTVNEKPDNMQEPWTLELVMADGESVAVGSTGHKLTMTSAGTIKAGQVTTAIPGLTLSFGKTGDKEWTVAQDNNHFSGLYVADADPVTLPEESYIPTGGAYLGLEPTVNGVLSLHTAYYGLQSVVVVDKETNTVVASRRIGSSTSNAYENYEFTVPLQADRTYYVYNIGNSNEGTEPLKYDMPVNAITFTPVFLDRIGHVIVKNNTYNITGAQLADDIHDYPTFSHVHAEEGGSVHYHSTSDVIYLDEEGNLVIDGEGTATLEAHVSHTDANGADCHSVAQCTVTYTKSQLKFSGTGYIVAENLVDEFVEPTLTLPEEISESTVAYEINGSELSISSEGNISKSVTTLTPGSEFVVTAKIEPNNIYYKDKVTYTIKIANSMSPFKYPEEITLKVGTRGYDLIKEGVITYGVKTDGITVGGNKDPLAELFNGTKMPNLYFNDHTKPNKVAAGFGSSDGVIAFVNKDLRVDARAVGTATVKLQSKTYDTSSGGQYIETPITLKINVIEDEDIVEKLADWDNITLRTWSFNKGFNETEINNLPNNFANQTHNSNTVLKVDGAEFWTIINGTAKTKSAQAAYQGDDGKWYRDESTLSYLIDESLPLVLTNTSYNYENTKDYGQGSSNDEDKLLFSTWREGTSLYGPSDKEGDLNLTSEHTLNVNTSLTPITGVDKDEYTEGYKGIQLNGKASFIKVTDVQSGMYMTVIADNPEDGYVQLASDGKYQALGECIFKKDYKDVKDPNNNLFKGNRVTNVFPYMKSDVTTAAFEHDGESAVTNIMVGYPAGSGLLNVGGGEKAPVVNNGPQRTYGYATFVSPYNIDLTGQTALKAYICDYYGKDNNLVHMVQIKHIPANTPVMLKGYARDMYVLYISEGNKPVEHGISEEVFAKNRLVGALEDDMMVQPTEEGLYNGAVTTWHNLGLTQNKFRTFTVPSSIAKGRAYLRITQEEYEDLYAAYVAASAASTTTKIVFEDTDFDYSSDVTTPTGIENLENVAVTVGDGHYYNLNGVRVNGIPTQKGIYIRNGKKIVVR